MSKYLKIIFLYILIFQFVFNIEYFNNKSNNKSSSKKKKIQMIQMKALEINYLLEKKL